MCRETSGEVLDAVKNRARDGDVSAARLVIEQAWGRVPIEEQIMSRAETDAEMAKATSQFLDGLERALTPFPGALDAVRRAVEVDDGASTER